MLMRSLLAAALLSATAARAEWKAEYGQADQAAREWYSTRMLTDATKQRIDRPSFNYCCSHGDTVKTHFQVSKTDNGDEWTYQLPDGSWKVIPPDTVQAGPTPDGKPVLFVDPYWHLGEVCFFPGEGGG
jgi:hypothetical protein